MRFTLPATMTVTPLVFARRAGYHPHPRQPDSGELSLVAPVGGSRYPRFHLYVTLRPSGGYGCTLHFDMKEPSYAGTKAHSGESDTPLVLAEAQRLQTLADAYAS